MKPLRYNVAPEQRLNLWRFWITVGVFITVAGLLVWSGIQTMNLRYSLSEDEQETMDAVRITDGDYRSKMETLKREIDLLKRRWNGRVRFTNALIDRKVFSFLEGMDLLEETLPAPVYLSSLRLDQDRKRRLEMEIFAMRFSDLIACYRRLSRFSLEVNSENRDRNGRYRVSLTLRY